MKPSSRTNKGRSLTTISQIKSDYLELKTKQYAKHGMFYSLDEITNRDFGLSLSNFMECEAEFIMKKVRAYVYKMVGKYFNNHCL